ncbi:OTU domain-containing protein 7B-like isoform X2 [Watersipora subatra]|uniref:OTU domain-containing protein 7B-like isoform X2 n=1 Tax=Watersipora subatra TaxID=2589382 RepID=UPI00355B6D15
MSSRQNTRQKPPRPADRSNSSSGHRKYETSRTPAGSNGTTGRRTSTTASKKSSETPVRGHQQSPPSDTGGARYSRQSSNEYEADIKPHNRSINSTENYSQRGDTVKLSNDVTARRTADTGVAMQQMTNNPLTDVNSVPSLSADDPYLNVSSSEQVSLVKDFMAQTNSQDFNLTNDILAGTNWNLEAAVQAYRQIQTDQSETPRPKQTISSHSADQMSSSQSQATSSESSNLEKGRRLLRGLSKVYDLRDGAQSIERDKVSILKAASDPNCEASQLNVNISLDNTYVLPDLSTLSSGFADYIEQELIDFVTMNVLERSEHINWWAKHSLSRRLWPLHTTGDGNCLLHAASLGMWGVQDKHLHLRYKLHQFLSKQSKSGPLYRRWRWQQTQSNMEMSLIFSEEEWQSEWEGLINLSSATTKVFEEDGHEYEYLEFLEEFHVYVLAQIIGRPIIVFADSVIRDVNGFPLSPVPFGGIYLPMECRAKECFKSPLLLAYDRSHFTAVVTMSNGKTDQVDMKALIPLTGPDCDLLPMHFFVDPGSDVNWENLPEDKCTMLDIIGSIQDYLEVRKIPLDQVKAGLALSDDSLSDSGSTSLLNKEKKVKATSGKGTILKRSNSKSSSKVKEAKNVPSDLELEPGNELVMCAKLSIRTPKAYAKDMDKYLAITRQEYDDKKARNALKDPKTIPLIATKDYARKLALELESSTKLKKSPAAISPNTNMCRRCEQYLGTVEQDNLCSACYKQRDGEHTESDRCRLCHKFQGTKEHHFYCSKCYQQLLEGGSATEPEQVNNSNASGNSFREKYEIQMSDGDDDPRQYKNDLLARPGNSRGNFTKPSSTFPTAIITEPVAGNSRLTLLYDQSHPAGYLRRSPPTRKKESRNVPTLTLGIDSDEPHDGLHMVPRQELTKSYSIPRATIYQDEQRGIEIPINHYDSPPRSAMPRGSGGISRCKHCGNLAMPADVSGLCRVCRVDPQAALRQSMPNRQSSYNRIPTNQPVQMYKHAKSLQLSLCRRTGCQGTACSNNGLCNRCTDLEQRLKAKSLKHSRYESLY